MLKFYFSPITSLLATHIALIECDADGMFGDGTVRHSFVT